MKLHVVGIYLSHGVVHRTLIAILICIFPVRKDACVPRCVEASHASAARTFRITAVEHKRPVIFLTEMMSSLRTTRTIPPSGVVLSIEAKQSATSRTRRIYPGAVAVTSDDVIVGGTVLMPMICRREPRLLGLKYSELRSLSMNHSNNPHLLPDRSK